MSARAIAVRNIARAEAAVIDRLQAGGVSTVQEAQGRSGLLQPYLRPVWRGAAIAGSAVTVLAQPGDNWMLHVAVELCQPGDVLVVACTTENHDGMFGELLATSCAARGVRGLVIDAGCRDVMAMEAMRFPVWSRAVNAKGTVKATPGSVNVPVVCAGALVRPGDVIVADQDGVVVVERQRAATVAQASEARLRKEDATRARLAAGELGLDIYGMRDKLREAGLMYVDTLDEAQSH
ncbi:4-carboxy-4-hydroxy-2-oxoadipate aldolase/oxaloacetate decarboxylase [Achromobacter piechaudii]|uniref:4-hydroxy-4-methyl-2-oxoglutarate aldolase n=1 Tax=Achromobacter piechaudii ATCC 43553 TaxID=742159 RepID=D4XEY3_9BURK|nr:4-carboxy-4-hydroxy-2-oxoadipate aldolase/oxaloacetate decarboxylase [Achromobacter piechaudii]EFF74660.1 4-carboxy-4-hydroxy-2-oxoadipate aldolase/oxaloacetate decarboxylase [Achromobacter piechaudii ATCC 43553]